MIFFRIMCFAGWMAFFQIGLSIASEQALLPTSFQIPEKSEIPKMVKVALLVSVPSVSILIPAPYEIQSIAGKLLQEGAHDFEGSIRPVKGGIEIGQFVYP